MIKKVLKISLNIFLSRASGPISVAALFSITGYLNRDYLGQLNIYFSFLSIFSALSAITLIYHQNESADKSNKVSDEQFNQGFRLAVSLGFLCTLLSTIAACFLLYKTNIFIPALITGITFVLFSPISYLTYYLEAIGRGNISSKLYIVYAIIKPILFFVLAFFEKGVLFSATITLLLTDILLLFALIFYCNKKIDFLLYRLKKKDFLGLINKGLPISLGVVAQKYAYSVIILATALYSTEATQIYTVITGLVFIFILPQVGIAHASSIYISTVGIRSAELKSGMILSLLYFLICCIIILLSLPYLSLFLYNYQLQAADLNNAKIATILFLAGQVVTGIVVSLARAYNIIKIPQVLVCFSLFIGMIIAKKISTTLYEYMNFISYSLIVGGILSALYTTAKIYSLPSSIFKTIKTK